ncbi:MAG: SDR family NAD(P)-dependent oxidoreductase [Legionellales bacterium]
MIKKRIVIIGATSLIAEHCARLWVTTAAIELVLVGRDRTKIEIIAADLRLRSPASCIKSIQADFTDPEKISALVDGIVKLAAVDIVLIAHGSLASQQLCQSNLVLCNAELTTNALSPVLFAEAFAKHLQQANAGTLAIISSVAGDRGRKSNYIYGAAKGLLTRYAQGLQHRLAQTEVKVVLIKPGPTNTPMTAALQQQKGKLARVEDVAKRIVIGINNGKPVVYAPAKWAFIMMLIRHLPAFIFNKMDI